MSVGNGRIEIVPNDPELEYRLAVIIDDLCMNHTVEVACPAIEIHVISNVSP